MKFSAVFLRRFHWLKLPGALLIVLLQRSPVLRVAAVAEETLTPSPLGAVLCSAIATVASLGTMHAQAGATTPTIKPPTIPSPLKKKVGDNVEVVFSVLKRDDQADPAGWRIEGAIPPGVKFGDRESPGVVSGSSTISLKGTATRVGTYKMVIDAARNGIFSDAEVALGHVTLPLVYEVNVDEADLLAPAIVTQPSSQSVSAGTTVTFTVTAIGAPVPTFQWRRNGADISGATANSLTLSGVQAADAGGYSVAIANSAGSVTSATATLTVTSPAAITARLTNLSVRTAMAANQTLIVGVVVNDGSRDILVRAAGPALLAFGLSTAMADPQLELYNGPAMVLSNNDWPASLAPTFTSVGAFGFPDGSKDAAFMRTLLGAHSIWARGAAAGVVLVEAYAVGAESSARLVNVSARNQVGAGDDILIAGFTIAGAGSKQLLIRAVGPKLSAFGVGSVLVDPKLEIYDSYGVKVDENDNWSSSLAATFLAVAAFPLDNGSRDAALLATLTPGSYTAQVRGADGGTGEALIEIYEVR